MYILISIHQNGGQLNEKVSNRKNKLLKYLKENGFWYSKRYKSYIDNKNGESPEYIIQSVEEII